LLPLVPQDGDGLNTTSLEISEDGELRFLYVGAGEPGLFNGIRHTVLYLEAVAFIVRDMLAFTLNVSNHTGHSAMWEFGLAVAGIRGARARASNPRVFTAEHHEYPGSTYWSTARATVLDLHKAPGAVTERLIGLLYRTLDLSSSAWFNIPLEDAETEQEPELED
jgi:hypothetical protein